MRRLKQKLDHRESHRNLPKRRDNVAYENYKIAKRKLKKVVPKARFMDTMNYKAIWG